MFDADRLRQELLRSLDPERHVAPADPQQIRRAIQRAYNQKQKTPKTTIYIGPRVHPNAPDNWRIGEDLPSRRSQKKHNGKKWNR